jgi:hypothetical protein
MFQTLMFSQGDGTEGLEISGVWSGGFPAPDPCNVVARTKQIHFHPTMNSTKKRGQECPLSIFPQAF